MTKEILTNFLNTQIPVTQLMGVQVQSIQANEIRISAPLSINKNHMGTAFGGSLSTLMILSCYSWLFTLLKEKNLDFHIVIKDAETKYLAPVTIDPVAIAFRPDEPEVERFLLAYEKKGVGRIKLSSQVLTPNGQPACLMTGTFVAKK